MGAGFSGGAVETSGAKSLQDGGMAEAEWRKCFGGKGHSNHHKGQHVK